MVQNFKNYLVGRGLASNTVKAYSIAVQFYYAQHTELSAKALLAHREYLVSHYKPQTVNLHIIGLNSYLNFLNRKDLCLHVLKRQQKTFLENVISNAQYIKLKRQLLADHDLKKYHIVWTLAATGVRVSELVRLKVEDVVMGYIDLISKGGKSRRIYFPAKLQKSLLAWCHDEKRMQGPLFVNPLGMALSVRSVAKALRKAARLTGIDPKVAHPHAFRHLFAKNFLNHRNDLALLADLLGHESLETTKIYLRYTMQEQWDIVNNVVDW